MTRIRNLGLLIIRMIRYFFRYYSKLGRCNGYPAQQMGYRGEINNNESNIRLLESEKRLHSREQYECCDDFLHLIQTTPTACKSVILDADPRCYRICCLSSMIVFFLHQVMEFGNETLSMCSQSVF